MRSQDVVELGYTPLLWVFLVRELSCMSSPIHSASLVGRYWSTGWCFLCAYSCHTGPYTVSAGAERSILSLARPPTQLQMQIYGCRSAVVSHNTMMQLVVWDILFYEAAFWSRPLKQATASSSHSVTVADKRRTKAFSLLLANLRL